MKLRTILFDIFFLFIFLAGSVYSYSRYKSASEYALVKQKAARPPLYTKTEYLPAEGNSARPLLEGPPPVPRPASPRSGNFFYNGPGNSGILFSWRGGSNPGGTYTLRVSTRPDLRRPLIQETVRDPFYFLPPARLSILPEATFYWAVLYTDSEGESSPYSAPREFYIGLNKSTFFAMPQE